MSSTDRCEGEWSRTKPLAILKSATKGFALQGYAGARTEGVARAVDVNHALVFYHFKMQAALDDSEVHRRTAPRPVERRFSISCPMQYLKLRARLNPATVNYTSLQNSASVLPRCVRTLARCTWFPAIPIAL
jgi:hypothetical protein